MSWCWTKNSLISFVFCFFFALFLLAGKAYCAPGVRVNATAARAAHEAMEKFKAKEDKKIRDMARQAAGTAKKRLNEPAADLARKLAGDEDRGGNAKGIEDLAGKRYSLVISSSIPMATLRTYAGQIEDLRKKGLEIDLVLRGFVSGMKEIRPTLGFYIRMALRDPCLAPSKDNMRDLGLLIDPERAEKVKAVPALVDEKGCVVYGDAPLSFLVQKIREGECGRRFGATFEYAERDALEEIREAARHVDTAKYQKILRGRVDDYTENLPGEGLLPAAAMDSVRTITPQYELPFDVKNPDTGEVLYPKGFRYNPLDYAPALPFDILVVDGVSMKEIAWVKRAFKSGLVPGDARVSVLGGNYRELSDELGRPVFSGVSVVKKGWCRATPCLVSRRGSQLVVHEFLVQEGQVE